MLWKGGMSFHGGLLGVIISCLLFCKSKNLEVFSFLDIIACSSPIGIFLGRMANFINGELIGKITNVNWGVIFPLVDNFPRHPSQLYEAFLEGLLLFILMNIIYFRKNYKIGDCSIMFLIFYGLLRIISEIFREPDQHLGYIFDLISTGSLLSLIMIIAGSLIYFKLR